MEEIEILAEEFLVRVPGYLWDGETLLVPVEDVADTHLGLPVRSVDDLGLAPGAPVLDDDDAMSGLLLPALGEIWVNAAEVGAWPMRWRFTIAHELNRCEMHRGAAQAVFRRAGVANETAQGQRLLFPLPEGQANVLSSTLLMLAAASAVRPSRPRLCAPASDLWNVRGGGGAPRLRAVIAPAG